MLLGEGSGNMLGIEPALYKNSLGQGKDEGAQSLEMELSVRQGGSGRSWRARQTSPTMLQVPETGHIQEAEPRDTWGWPECGQGSIRGCYLMFS